MSLVGSSFQDMTFRPGWVGGADSGDINPMFEQEHLAGFQKRITEGAIFTGMTQKQTLPTGRDTMTWDQHSGAKLTKLARGVIPDTSVGTSERLSLEVDTVLIARTPIAKIDLLLSNPDTLASITEEHAIEFLKQHDRMVPLMAIKAAQISAKIANAVNDIPNGTFTIRDGWWRATLAGVKPGWTGHQRNVVVGFRGGTAIELPALGWKDWQIIEQAMTATMIKIGKKNIDQVGSGGKWFVSWDIYGTLLQNDRYTSMKFSRWNSDITDQGLLDTVHNIAVIPTNRLADLAQDVGVRNLMSNARNNFAYDVTLDDARCCAVWFSPKALKEIELISHHSVSFYSEIDHTRYIDDMWSYAVGPDRLEFAGAIFRNAIEFATKQDLIDAGEASSYVPGTTTLW